MRCGYGNKNGAFIGNSSCRILEETKLYPQIEGTLEVMASTCLK